MPINFYFQDAWKILPRLLFSYGFRYEVNSRIREQKHMTACLEMRGLATRYLINPKSPYGLDGHGWGPRLAVDWGMNDHTLLRVGGSITTLLPNLWQHNQLTGGTPYTVYPTLTAAPGQAVPMYPNGYTGAGGTDRPDRVDSPILSTSRPVREDYFGRGASNSSFFSIPINVPEGNGPNHGRFGTLGRNTFRGPGFHNFDYALIKDTPLGRKGRAEALSLQFRAEFFNVFNLVNFGLPVNTVLGPGFGVSSRTAGTSHQIQFSLKLLY